PQPASGGDKANPTESTRPTTRTLAMNTMQGINLGLTTKKKSTHRGRKPSAKPGAQHLSALTQAHGRSDLKTAKVAALNYAKAVHTAMGAPAEADADQIPGPDDQGNNSLSVSMAGPTTQSAPAPSTSMARMAAMRRIQAK